MNRGLTVGLLFSFLGVWAVLVPGLLAQNPDLQRAINNAIDRGVEYLKKQQKEDGSWDRQGDPGATTLCAWTLLESGVARDDPSLVKAAKFIRTNVIRESKNYNLSLAIIFLDKLGDPQDVPLIESLGIRLLAGQTQYGGWAYTSPDPPDREVQRLTQIVARYKPGQVKGPAPKKDISRIRHYQELDREIKAQWQVLANRKKEDLNAELGDNSNTQFAMIALWIARRYGLPVDHAMMFVEWRFRSNQMADGHWHYEYLLPDTPPTHVHSSAMTCAGLLGLALGHATATNRGLKRDLSGDPNVRAGLNYLGNVVKAGFKDPPDPLVPGNKLYYFLWSLERMAVVYDLKQIGGVDWYVWGAKQLVALQNEDGSWHGAFSLGNADTCFALLFLKKVNVVDDLTASLKSKAPAKPPASKGKEPPPVDLTPFIPKEGKKPGDTKRIPTEDKKPTTNRIPEIDDRKPDNKKPTSKRIPEEPQGWLHPGQRWEPQLLALQRPWLVSAGGLCWASPPEKKARTGRDL